MNKLIDIAFLVGSGRVSVETEFELFAVVGAEGMADWNRKMRTASESQINQTWAIVKATPAGSQLA